MTFLPRVVPPIERTPFGETRVAQPFTQGDHVQTYGLLSDVFDQQVDGGAGGVIANVLGQSAVSLILDGVSGSFARKATREWFRYQAGKAARWRKTLYHLDSGKPNQRRRWGQLDFAGSDGLIWQLNGTALSIERLTSVAGQSGESVLQEDWSVDTLSDSLRNPSGFRLDITDSNIYTCSYPWLGVAKDDLPIQFFINGALVHEMDIATDAPYMRTATLPLFWEVINLDTSEADGGLVEICSTVISEGGSEPPRFPFGHLRLAVTADDTVDPVHVFSLRGAPTFKTVDNRVVLLPTVLTMSATGNEAIVIVRENATLTTPAWDVEPDDNSSAQIDEDGTAPTGGTVRWNQLVPKDGSIVIPLDKIYSRNTRKLVRNTLEGSTQDSLTIEVIKATGANAVVNTTLNWDELR